MWWYIGAILGISAIICVVFSLRHQIICEISNLSFKWKYHNTAKGLNNPMARLTEEAYIKGLNQGYALAKAQYDNRRAILFCSPDEYICQNCGHRVSKNAIDTPSYCKNCGSKFYTIQTTSYDPNNDLE